MYLPLQAKLAKKHAITNVKNRDNECLKWTLRSAKFPAEKNPQRPSKYPVSNGINYEGMDFLAALNKIDRLDVQNRVLAINAFGWENGSVVIYRIGGKTATGTKQ